jgi:enoyl-[acyl-carrier-protein] reductase (NADH)
MAILSGKKGLVFGIADERSLAHVRLRQFRAACVEAGYHVVA